MSNRRPYCHRYALPVEEGQVAFKNVDNESCSPNLLFLNENRFEDDQVDF